MKSKGRYLYGLVLLPILTYFVRGQQLRQYQAESEAAYGHFTRTQILDRTELLCQSVWPQFESLTLTSDKTAYYRRELASDQTANTAIRVWYIICETTGGDILGHFCWNADTGDLILLGAQRQDISQAAAPQPRDLVRISRQWLWTMCLNKKGESWQLSKRGAVSSADEVVVSWRSQYRRADVALRHTSGQLLFLSVKSGKK